ncbi:MAG TPA: LON peptidase substrate-binding domain-containing protein, partial [Candidatus Baltobacteraceae bacterium]
KQMIAECLECGDSFGVALIREGDEAGDPQMTPHEIGTTAEICDVTPLENGRYYISTTGRRRFRIEHVISREPYLLADVTFLGEELAPDVTVLEQLVDEIRDVFHEYLRLLVDFSGMQVEIILPPDPSDASFVIGDSLQVADSMKQRLLELSDTEQRLTVELGFLRRLLPQLRSLLERKRETPRQRRGEAQSGGAFRTRQEKYFGKFFSLN